MPPATPPGVPYFEDNDQGFHNWLDSHPAGYFVNCERNPKPDYLVLHHTGCSHFTRNPSLHWTRDYIKVCAPDRGSLEQWATGTVGGAVTLCPTCLG